MAIIILCLWSPSPKHCHDLHRHRHDTMISIILIFINVSSHGRLTNYCFLQLLLSHSDKVKQLYGACILFNKETTIRPLPVADNFNKTWSSHTTIYISSRLDHITSQHALQKQVRRPVLCCCKFYVVATGWERTILTYASKPERFFVKCDVLTFNKD